MNSMLFMRDPLSVVITGDSLSYNRHGFDPKSRPNAYDCGAGLPSWSFTLRDRLLALDPAFTLGASIEVDCPYESGLANDCPVPHTAAFGGRIKTLFPKESASFFFPVSGEQIVLYLQRRADAPTVTDIYVDGTLAAKDVDTVGTADDFVGYGLMTVTLRCRRSDAPHKIEFRNLRAPLPKITLAAAGERRISVALSGKGGECTDYFVEHFEDRIGRFSPDLLILSLGANDRGYRTVKEMQEALVSLYGMLFERFPHCRVLHLLPPSAHDPDAPLENVSPYCARERCQTYDRATETVIEDLNRAESTLSHTYPIELLRTDRILDPQAVREWRFDNIHMNPHGNRLLLEAVSRHLGLHKNEC